MKAAQLNASNRMFDSKGSITLCITELDVGGAEKSLVRIAIGLKGLGWAVRVISLRDAGTLSEDLKKAGIEIVALGCGGVADIRAFWRLRAQLRNSPTDVLLTFLYQANFYGRLAGRAAGIRTIVSGIRVADRRVVVKVTDRLTKCCVDHYIAVSRNVAEVHARLCRIDADQISVIYNGVDAARASSPRDEPPVILFAGRLTEQKNPLLLLQAFRRLPSKLQQKCEVHFAGEGPLQFPLEEELKNGQLSDCVKLLGHRLDIAALMQRATVLVLPSKWEGLPNVVLEAMAAGLPVIATAVDGIQELLEDGVTGWLVPSDDEAALSEAIQEALTAPETRRQRATAAQVVAAEQFKWELVVSKYDQLLTSLRQD